jgi:3-dehydroquinate synthase
VLITDKNVKQFYENDFPPHPAITIDIGEKIKNLDTIRNIYEKLVAVGADRSTFIVGIGGGIVCDISGFVASTYLRGVRFGFVSSTLLSQVDASVGGKNGVNFKDYTNMIGVFNQPEFVICDLNLLNTLPKKEILNGMAEIVKHGIIEDASLFAYLEKHFQKALSLDVDVIEKLVYDSIIIKSAIVNQDELEKGARRKLNFGHTFGHAFEKTTGVAHGEAVSAGMVVASQLCVKRGHLSAKDAERIESLLQKIGLPVRIQAEKKSVFDALKKDKKRKGDHIYFVLLNKIGNAFVDQIPITELEAVIHSWMDTS